MKIKEGEKMRKFLKGIGGMIFLFLVVTVGSVPEGSITSTSVEQMRKHHRDLYYMKDTAVDTFSYVFDLLDEYADMKGEYVGLPEIQQEGYAFFPLANPYTGQPLKETCGAPSPGDYCLKLSDPYTLDFLYFYDSTGQPFSSLWRSPVHYIPPPIRNQPSPFYTYVHAEANHYTELQMKLVFLGNLLNRRIRVGYKKGKIGLEAVREGLSVPLYHQFQDPVTGQMLTFDGSGYGDRVQFTVVKGNRILLQVYDSEKVVYEAEIGATKYSAFSLLHIPLKPGLVPPEDPEPDPVLKAHATPILSNLP